MLRHCGMRFKSRPAIRVPFFLSHSAVRLSLCVCVCACAWCRVTLATDKKRARPSRDSLDCRVPLGCRLCDWLTPGRINTDDFCVRQLPLLSPDYGRLYHEHRGVSLLLYKDTPTGERKRWARKTWCGRHSRFL